MCTKSRTEQGSIHNPLSCHRARATNQNKTTKQKAKTKTQTNQTKPKNSTAGDQLVSSKASETYQKR
jgi:hypothetical protein